MDTHELAEMRMKIMDPVIAIIVNDVTPLFMILCTN